ncbi:MAG: hypothetical protein LBU36_04130 [Clostridiales bacterium]|jgi:septum formation inhibitor-activating ATPase MinD|nr:hypothetical protein [Clostridiales bacterium]
MNYKRITIFLGHYGSGKTSVALSYAAHIREREANVALADMDVVNPYFRSADSAAILSQKGIKLIASAYAGSNLDVPAIPAEGLALFHNPGFFSVADVGGDDRGAAAIGRYSALIQKEPDCDVLLVVNRYRPLSQTAREVARIREEIEAAARIRFTGIVNNSNVGRETTAEHVKKALPFAREASEKTGLPLIMTTAAEGLDLSGLIVPGLFRVNFLKNPKLTFE